jgi:hypothetical protein
MLSLTGFLFKGAIPIPNFMSPVFWLELGLNVLLAPFLFALLKAFGNLLTADKREE